MILRGPKTNHSNNPYYTQAMLTLCQLLIFNTTKKTREYSSSSYHSETREAPVAMYIGHMTHSKTRKLGVVDKLFYLGLSISSDGLLNISTNLGNAAIEQFEKDNVVCPLKFRHNLFTVGAIDYIDVDTSSATAMSSFHGTAASLHQKVPQKDAGEKRNITTEFSNNKLNKLPDYYTDIPAAYLPPKIKMTETTKIPVKTSNANGMEDDKVWLTFFRNEALNA